MNVLIAVLAAVGVFALLILLVPLSWLKTNR